MLFLFLGNLFRLNLKLKLRKIFIRFLIELVLEYDTS